MDKKALMKAIAVVLIVAAITAVGCVMVETGNPILVGIFLGLIITAAAVAIGYAAYEYFKEEEQ
jgi:hypothetical protein